MIKFQDDLTEVYCEDAIVTLGRMRKEGKQFDLVHIDPPWAPLVNGEPWAQWIRPYLLASLEIAKVTVVNCGIQHIRECDTIRSFNDLFVVVRPTLQFAQVGCLYGIEGLARNYVVYEDKGERISWHPESYEYSRGEGVVECFPEATRIFEAFMGSGPLVRVARKKGIFSVGAEINETYCDHMAKELSS